MIKSLFSYHPALKFLWWIALVITYIAAIVPQDMAPTMGGLSDKSHHILAFIVLGMLLRLAYPITYWYAFISLVGFGIFIEISQLFAINRSGDIVDVLADVIGVFIGLKLYKYTKKVIL